MTTRKNTKAAAMRRTHSKAALSRFYHRDRGTITRILDGTRADDSKGRFPRWRAVTFEAAAAAHAAHRTTPSVFRDRKISEQIRKLAIANDRLEAGLVSRQSVCESIARMITGAELILQRRLEEEYPSAVAGLDVAQARIYGRRLSDSIRVDLGKLSGCFR